MKSDEMKTGCGLTESYKEGYGSKKSCFATDYDNLPNYTTSLPIKP
jgi:hypothetical protein